MIKLQYTYGVDKEYLVTTTDLRNLINRKDIHLVDSECAIERLISKGERVWDYCRGCKEDDCKYNLGLEARTEV